MEHESLQHKIPGRLLMILYFPFHMYEDDGAFSRKTNIAVGIFGMSLLYALLSHLIVHPSFTGFWQLHIVLACTTNNTFFCPVAHIHLWLALLCYIIWFVWASRLFIMTFFCGYLCQADVGVKFQPSVASALHNQGLLCLPGHVENRWW